MLCMSDKSRDSSVGIALGYGLDDWSSGLQIKEAYKYLFKGA